PVAAALRENRRNGARRLIRRRPAARWIRNRDVGKHERKELPRMTRLYGLAIVCWLGVVAVASADVLCWGCGVRCITPPPPQCPDCSGPCDKRLCLCWPKQSAHAHELIDQLAQGDCCERIKAAKKLGCRWHADFCCDPDVLAALVR